MQQPHRIMQEAKLLPAWSVDCGQVIEGDRGLKVGPYHSFPAEFLALLAEFPVLQQALASLPVEKSFRQAGWQHLQFLHNF